MPRYELQNGLAVGGFTGASSLNPLESGRSFIDFRPFYRSQNIENNHFSSTISTNGIDVGLTWDNRDFPINPARGQSVTLAVSRDFGLFDSSASWTVLQSEVDQYFELGELPQIRQSVLALGVWTADTPSWKKQPDGNAAHRPPAYAGANGIRSTPGRRSAAMPRSSGFSSCRSSRSAA